MHQVVATLDASETAGSVPDATALAVLGSALMAEGMFEAYQGQYLQAETQLQRSLPLLRAAGAYRILALDLASWELQKCTMVNMIKRRCI